MEYSTSMKEANTKVIVTKMVILIDHLAVMANSRSLWNCKIHFAISSKNEGGHIHLCQNSVTFTLPTTVALVKCTLVTTFALGSF